jgi:ubiquinone/menaquinone biosynthesis C-methylase UbiE
MEDQRIEEMLRHENEAWNRVFKSELAKDGKDRKDFSSYWWKSYYEEIGAFVCKKLEKFSDPKILEAGSGSGKASLLLGKNYKRTLFDISDSALEYARYLSKHFGAENTSYVQGNIFSMPFPNNNFNFVWNIGVVEHYESEGIISMVSEMTRVTDNGGLVAIAIPNFKSLPIIKASILRNRFLRFVPGYRLDSEHGYSEEQMLKMIEAGVKKQARSIRKKEVVYFGNPLFMESPRWLIRSLGKVMERLAPKSKFLMMVFVEVE